jgi:hypothetical protein
MKKGIRNDLSDLGYYVEGDYMVEETNEKEVIFKQENLAGSKITVHKDYIIQISNSTQIVVYDFDNKEDWENFLEALWKGERYMAVRKKDFIEFFQALRHLHGHHCRQMDAVVGRQELIQKEINEQQERLGKLKNILNHYEEYYTEAYEEVHNENKV